MKLLINMQALLSPLLNEILSIPNDAFYPEEIEKNIQWCEKAFAQRGFSNTRIETQTVPLLLAERKHSNAEKTVLVYLQIDGQPVDSTRWFQESPYTPTLKKQYEAGDWVALPWRSITEYQDDWRVFARSASDAKGPVAMFLTALDASGDMNITPNYNLKVIMDFEEELGFSPASQSRHGACCSFKGRHARHFRWATSYYQPAHPYIRRSWYCHITINHLWSGGTAAQWSFWELCPKPGLTAIQITRFDER